MESMSVYFVSITYDFVSILSQLAGPDMP
uniref:Uncharacterized protein n=1 Tax=Arundo donax TaxID=35708 RepID=A0A0A8YBT5_ARUDO